MSKDKQHLFDYSEGPIKNWISKFLEEDESKLFDEKKCEVQGISVKDNYNTVYNLYLSTDEQKFCLSKDEFNDNEYVRQGVSALYDAVYTAYQPIASICKFQGDLNPLHIIPYFNEDDMDFSVSIINKLGLERYKIDHKLKIINEQIAKGNKQITKSDDKQLTKDISDMYTIRSELLTRVMNITEEKIKEEAEKVNKLNEKKFPKLYINCVYSGGFGSNLKRV